MENNEAKTCKFCLDSDGSESMISPCLCKGSQKFVHRSCLDQWRFQHLNDSFVQCTICKYKYKMSRIWFASVLQHQLTISTLTFIAITSTVLFVSVFINTILMFFVGSGTILASKGQTLRSVLSVSTKIVWWSVMLIGFITMLIVIYSSEDRVQFGRLSFEVLMEPSPVVQFIFSGFSLCGFGLFCRPIYLFIRTCIELRLNQLGEHVLNI